MLEAVKQNGTYLIHCTKRLRDDKEVVLAAVNQDGLALAYASDALKGDFEVTMAAVYENWSAFSFSSPYIQNGALLAFVKELMEAYTTPPCYFWSTILYGLKGKSGGTRRSKRLHLADGKTCFLSKLNLGVETTHFLMKKIGHFAGLQCKVFCTVPWYQVLEMLFFFYPRKC